jgi:hypothetical protein
LKRGAANNQLAHLPLRLPDLLQEWKQTTHHVQQCIRCNPLPSQYEPSTEKILYTNTPYFMTVKERVMLHEEGGYTLPPLFASPPALCDVYGGRDVVNDLPDEYLPSRPLDEALVTWSACQMANKCMQKRINRDAFPRNDQYDNILRLFPKYIHYLDEYGITSNLLTPQYASCARHWMHWMHALQLQFSVMLQAYSIWEYITQQNQEQPWIRWIRHDPGQQATSSFTPDPTSTPIWYGTLYKPLALAQDHTFSGLSASSSSSSSSSSSAILTIGTATTA